MDFGSILLDQVENRKKRKDWGKEAYSISPLSLSFYLIVESESTQLLFALFMLL
jgi:hypothetical protein